MANLKILKLIDRKAELEAELEELKSKFESIPIEIQDNIDKLNASKLKLYKMASGSTGAKILKRV